MPSPRAPPPGTSRRRGRPSRPRTPYRRRPAHEAPDRLTVAQVAELVGVRPATWRSYVSREQAPAAVEHLDARTPLWDRAEVEAWAAARRRSRPQAQVDVVER